MYGYYRPVIYPRKISRFNIIYMLPKLIMIALAILITVSFRELPAKIGDNYQISILVVAICISLIAMAANHGIFEPVGSGIAYVVALLPYALILTKWWRVALPIMVGIAIFLLIMAAISALYPEFSLDKKNTIIAGLAIVLVEAGVVAYFKLIPCSILVQLIILAAGLLYAILFGVVWEKYIYGLLDDENATYGCGWWNFFIDGIADLAHQDE